MIISKIKDVKTPVRGTARSAGIDFFVPNGFDETVVNPGCHVRIASGIRAKIPTGYMLCAFNKSGVALSGLSVGACVIDEDYQGEINLHLFNETQGEIVIKPGQKLVQFILIPVFYDVITVVSDDKIHTEKTERGEGGFGSTGNGLDKGWDCEIAPDKKCHYYTDKRADGFYVTLNNGTEHKMGIEYSTRDHYNENEDECLFCGEPEERK